MKKSSSALALSFLSISALICLGCGSPGDSTNGDSNSTEQKSSGSPTQTLPNHTKLIPDDAWLVATVRPGQILRKLDYETVIHMPAIAFLYSAMNPDFGGKFDLEDEEERDMAAYITRMIEDPSESGIKLEADGYFFLGQASEQKRRGEFMFIPPLPSFGFILPLADHDKFETLVERLLETSRENDKVRRSSRNGTRFIQHKHWILAISEETAFFHGSVVEDGLDLGKVRESVESPYDIPADLATHLGQPFDAGFYLDYAGYLDWLLILMADEVDLDPTLSSKLFDKLKQGKATYEVTAENGRLMIEVRANFGEAFPYAFAGEGVGDLLLDLLPDDSIAAATLSINMEGIRKMLGELSGSIGDRLDLPPMNEPLPDLGLTIDEALSAFSGDLAVSLIDLPDEDTPRPLRDIPEFVLVLSTVDPASKVYQQILKQKLLALFDEAAREPLQAMGISLVAKDNRLILSSRGQAAILKAGKAPDPVSGETRDLLSNGYFNLTLDFAQLADALPIDRQDLRNDEEFALAALDELDRLSIQSDEKDGVYQVTFELSLGDKKTNFLKQVGTFVGNFLDPAWRDPKMRPRILDARKLAEENPENFRNSLVGAWKFEEEDEGDRYVSKYLNRSDGTHFVQHLSIESEGYYFNENEGRWAVYGNSLLEYDEYGLLNWVGGLLAVEPEKHDFYWVVEFDEYDTASNPRVPEDWQLPDPPKGLPELENVPDEFIDGDANVSEGDDQNASAK
jgi:hypothetical protein